ncbi:MAG: GntR family transcriptional regulator [Acidobacteriaceae bacterium]
MKSYKPILVKPAAPPSALPRQTLVATAVEDLRRRIISGEFDEGESLNQVMIAREYAISRIPLREAMRQLEVEGLLVFYPGKGAVVSKLSLNEIREVIDLRANIEPDILSRAVPLLTGSELDEADQILEEYDAAFKKGEVALWGKLNWRFHSTLYAASGRAITMGIVKNLHHLNERYAKVQLSITHWEQRASREHHEILEACRQRKQRSAAMLLKQHILSAGAALIDVLDGSQTEKGRKSSRRK